MSISANNRTCPFSNVMLEIVSRVIMLMQCIPIL